MAKATKATKAGKKSSAKASKKTAGKAQKRPNVTSTAKGAFIIPPHIQEALQAARGTKEALAQFQDNSPGQMLFTLITTLVGLVNQQIPTVFTTQNVNLFGDPNNLLDPLSFNGNVSAQASGSFCMPQSCHSVLGIDICIPPWVPCVDGEANASLDSLTGLAGMQITNFSIPNINVNGSTASATGTMQVSVPGITANGEAGASGGPDGFSVPISTSASATISDVTANATITVSCDLDQQKLTAFTISGLTLSYGDLSINIGALGPFNSLFNGLTFLLTNKFWLYMGIAGSTDQDLENALLGALQGVINGQL